MGTPARLPTKAALAAIIGLVGDACLMVAPVAAREPSLKRYAQICVVPVITASGADGAELTRDAAELARSTGLDALRLRSREPTDREDGNNRRVIVLPTKAACAEEPGRLVVQLGGHLDVERDRYFVEVRFGPKALHTTRTDATRRGAMLRPIDGCPGGSARCAADYKLYRMKSALYDDMQKLMQKMISSIHVE